MPQLLSPCFEAHQQQQEKSPQWEVQAPQWRPNTDKYKKIHKNLQIKQCLKEVFVTYVHSTIHKKSYNQPRQHIKKQIDIKKFFFLKSRDITLPTKVHLVKAMAFPVVMYGCESWTIKKAECRKIDGFWTAVLEKTLESPLDCKEIKPVHLKGDQSWVFIGRTDAESETPILWPPNVKNWLIGKDSDAGKDWRQEEKGMTEDKMVGWHHQLDGHDFQ